MSTLVCFALKEEAAPFRKLAYPLHGQKLFIRIVGIGRTNAEKSMRKFLSKNSPELVFTCGFAGGLNPDLKLGEVVFELSTANSQLAKRLIAAGAKPGTFFCADHIATTVADKAKLRYGTQADAVEMESAAIHAVCAERGIPCATVRVISDTAGEDLPLDFNALSKQDKSLSFGKLLLAIAMSPGKISALMGLHKKTRFAAKQLAGVLAKVVVQP
jgi:adenosylhomocysteine nucleosidase